MCCVPLYRCVWRLHRRNKRDDNESVLSEYLPAQQELCLADCGATAAPHHRHVYSLRRRGKQRQCSPAAVSSSVSKLYMLLRFCLRVAKSHLCIWHNSVTLSWIVWSAFTQVYTTQSPVYQKLRYTSAV